MVLEEGMEIRSRGPLRGWDAVLELNVVSSESSQPTQKKSIPEPTPDAPRVPKIPSITIKNKEQWVKIINLLAIR